MSSKKRFLHRIKIRKNYVVGLLVGGEVGWGVGKGVGIGVGLAVVLLVQSSNSQIQVTILRFNNN